MSRFFSPVFSKLTLRITLFFILFILLVRDVNAIEDSYNAKYVSSATTYYLSAGEIENLKKMVFIDESPDAAFRLYQYYNFSHYDEEERVKYLLIAAERGNCVAQQNLAYTYYRKGQFNRAYEWAQKAKLNGSRRIDTLLKKIARKIK